MSLFAKLLEIQRSVEKLLKDSSTRQYKYTSGTAVLNHIRPKMNELGILLKQEVVSLENSRVDYETRNGARSEMFSVVGQRFTWIDAETGEREVCEFAANGMNDWDKGLGSALTYAERYFLLKFFHIPTDEDDVDNENRKSKEPTAAPAQNNSAAHTNDESDLPWLNLTTKNGEETDTLKQIKDAVEKNPGSVTVAKLRKRYKISKKELTTLQAHGIK